ncbi:carbon-nitrogen hydrolase family protein [Nevskia sp.]|uniref:carbon-nitrogen hydrolase family protein n=1 Tax=Nevskia sp. TaxID=1929292 RepID=UPI0025D82879|nr:carbon-nitrogen hydrolase family protein [Nevskia sp.]
MSRAFTVAAAQFPVFSPDSWVEVEALVTQWVADAAAKRAKLLVFPEYGAMSIAHLDAATRSDLHGQIAAMQAYRDAWRHLHATLAAAHGVHILAGSFPWLLDDGRYVNRAFLCFPDGKVEYQDKCVMTRFEREQWNISSEPPIKVFDTTLGKIAITICYDSEFPLLARAACEAGAEIILVPSCTDTLAGYYRVKVGAQARALENQCHVVQSPIVGEAAWSPAVDVNIGAAAVYGPPDRGFPDDGIIAIGPLNEPLWLYAEIDPAKVTEVRENGAVRPFRHWPESAITAIIQR